MKPVESEQPEQEPHVPVVQQLAILAGILLLIFGTGYVPDVLRAIDGKRSNTANVPESIPEEPQPALNESKPIDHFENVVVQAESAYVWDVAEQRALYKKEPDKQLPLASVTKLMTALVAHELMGTTETVTITSDAVKQDGDSNFLGGDVFSLENLLDLTLLSSSNDGAFAIASAVGTLLYDEGDAATFVEAMNIRASELGLTQTYFRNPTGLDISESEGGSYGSARDMAFLMEHILTNYPKILEATTEELVYIEDTDGRTHEVENTNYAVKNIPGLIGSKTGYTDLAGGNLAVAFDAAFNRPVIVVVLGSSRSGRFEDTLRLVDSARKTIQQ